MLSMLHIPCRVNAGIKRMTMLPRAYLLPMPTALAAFSRVGDALDIGGILAYSFLQAIACTFWGNASGRGRKRPVPLRNAFTHKSTFIMV